MCIYGGFILQLICRKLLKFLKRLPLHTVILLACWCVFLFFGIYTAHRVNTTYSSMMHAFINSRMSIVSLTCVAFLPFLYSMVAFRLNQFYLLIPVVCIKAYAFGFICSLICVLFGTAGWLMRLLLVFTDSILVIPLLCYWCVNTLSSGKTRYSEIWSYIFLLLISVSIEYSFISPILAKLLDCTL